jgi:hypothetical protein
MPGLIRRLAGLSWTGRRRADSEHGGVAALVAVVLTGGVFFGLGAVVIDVGQLYVEREQLQSGADSASWAVAVHCASATAAAPCTVPAESLVASTAAAAVAKDHAATTQICINNMGCPGWSTTISCPAQPATPGSYVEVRTSTLTATAKTLLPPTFAGALAGQSYQGKQVGACARVAWGVPAAATVSSLTISQCDWNRMTNYNNVYYALPGVANLLSQIGVFGVIGLTPTTGTTDQAIPLNVPVIGSLPTCTTPVSLAVPRGYAWVGTPDANCEIPLNLAVNATLKSMTPNIFDNSAQNCAKMLQKARSTGQPLLVPIFDTVVGITSLLGWYHIIGFAAFVVTGYQNLITGLGATLSTLSAGLPSLAATLCGLGNCIYGYFTKALVPQNRPVFGSTQDFGAKVIGRTG